VAAVEAPPWHVTGTYFEACNCAPISPRRRRGGQLSGAKSTNGVCDFAISWRVLRGEYGRVRLDDLNVIMVGSLRDDEQGQPWRVCLYVDDRATPNQHSALAQIFTGQAGGTPVRNYAASIGEIYAVRSAHVELDHRRNQWSMRAEGYVAVSGSTPVESPLAISSDAPGHDRPGEELRTDVMQVNDSPLIWGVQARCGFATSFAYHSED
jgi:hypothetical protein